VRAKRESADPEATMAIAVKFLTPAVGAEITGVDLARLTDGEFAQVAEIWHQRAALLFRGQRIGDDDLIDFSRRFGELDRRRTRNAAGSARRVIPIFTSSRMFSMPAVSRSARWEPARRYGIRT
jgi:alpha-ketoglutarate-dependent taurine dioxygenase